MTKKRMGLVSPQGKVRDLPTATPPGPPIGMEKKLSPDDLATIKELFRPVEAATGSLANLRLDYLMKERQVVEAIGKSREKYNEMVLAIGKKIGIEVGPESKEAWRFNLDNGTFTRVG